MPPRRRYFSLDEANLLLPVVGARMNRALQMHGLLRVDADKLRVEGVSLSSGMLALDENPRNTTARADALLAESRALYIAIQEEVAAVEQLGAVVKELEIGLVDFWSYLDDGREVMLCWKCGERVIKHFHTPTAGFAGRTSIEGRRFFRERTGTVNP